MFRSARRWSAGIAVGLPLALSPVFAGCASNSKAGTTVGPVTTINSICPVQGDEFDNTNVDPSHMREWKGQKIGFCCSSSYKKFDKMTDAQKDEVLARAQANNAGASGG